MSDDLIDRQAAIDEIKEIYEWHDNVTKERIIEHFVRLPSAQPEQHYDEWCDDCKEYDKERHCCPRWNRVIRQTLKDAQPEQRWIPCSERLPKVYDNYLITTYDGNVDIGTIDPKKQGVWSACDADGFYWLREVIAWMPLPKPWKGGEQDDR